MSWSMELNVLTLDDVIHFLLHSLVECMSNQYLKL